MTGIDSGRGGMFQDMGRMGGRGRCNGNRKGLNLPKDTEGLPCAVCVNGNVIKWPCQMKTNLSKPHECYISHPLPEERTASGGGFFVSYPKRDGRTKSAPEERIHFWSLPSSEESFLRNSRYSDGKRRGLACPGRGGPLCCPGQDVLASLGQTC